MQIKPSVDNSFFVSIIGTYNESGFTYDSPIVERISTEEHSYTRETSERKYVSSDTREEILKIKCKEDELIRFLNDEANALKVIGWLFGKNKFRSRWLPGITTEEVEYKKHYKDAKDKYPSELVKQIGKLAFVTSLIVLACIFIMKSIFNVEVRMWHIIFIGTGTVFYLLDQYVISLPESPGKENTKNFDFEF